MLRTVYDASDPPAWGELPAPIDPAIGVVIHNEIFGRAEKTLGGSRR